MVRGAEKSPERVKDLDIGRNAPEPMAKIRDQVRKTALHWVQ